MCLVYIPAFHIINNRFERQKIHSSGIQYARPRFLLSRKPFENASPTASGTKRRAPHAPLKVLSRNVGAENFLSALAPVDNVTIKTRVPLGARREWRSPCILGNYSVCGAGHVYPRFGGAFVCAPVRTAGSSYQSRLARACLKNACGNG